LLNGGIGLITNEWVDFTIVDLSFDEEKTYTKDSFEEMVGDKFEAVELAEDGFPKYIWTTNYVFAVLRKHRFMGQLAMAGAPRTPDYKGA
jgi:hypothetical protein